MSNVPKTWYDGRGGGTRIDAEAMNDLEARLFGRISEVLSPTVFRGAWAPSTAYAEDDWVTYSNSVLSRNTAGTSGLSFASDAANWDVIIGGQELLFRAESLTPVSANASTTVADLGSFTGTFTLDRTRTVRFEFSASFTASAAAQWSVYLTDASNTVKNAATVIPTAALTLPFTAIHWVTLSAGTYTRKLRSNRASGSGTGTFFADATVPISFAATAL